MPLAQRAGPAPAAGETVLFCRCAHAAVLPAGRREAIEAALVRGRPGATVVDDLCGLAARRDPRLRELAAAPRLAVVACRPRSVAALFRAAGAPLDPARARLLDLRARPAAEVLDALGLDGAGAGPAGTAAPRAITPADGWIPWFPAIDAERCDACGQCVGFCLFGVYEPAGPGETPCVARPQNCKLNCPACARICPRTAIVFPKCPEAPFDGSPIRDEAAERERVRRDVGEFLGADPYRALEKRRRSRGRLVDPAALARAKAERERAAAAPRAGGSAPP